MKVASLVITHPTRQDFHTIFQLVPGGLQRFHFKKTFDLALPNEKEYEIELPNELVLKILFYLINIYLKESLYELATPLISFCKFTLKETYNQFFPTPAYPVSTLSLNFRLSRTLHFCQSIVDAVVGCKRSFSDYYVVETRNGHFSGKCFPWYMDTDISVSEMDHFFIEGIEEHCCYPLGSDIHNYAWIQSREREGIHHTTYFRSPIIVLGVLSFNHLVVHTKDDFDPTFYSIKHILQQVFGPHLGLYIYSGNDLDMNYVAEL